MRAFGVAGGMGGGIVGTRRIVMLVALLLSAGLGILIGQLGGGGHDAARITAALPVASPGTPSVAASVGRHRNIVGVSDSGIAEGPAGRRRDRLPAREPAP